MAKRKKANPWETVFSTLEFAHAEDGVPIRASDTELDAFSTRIGHRLPESYRVFLRRYGPGWIHHRIKLLSPLPKPLQHHDLFRNTDERRWLYGEELAASVPDPELMRRAVYFADNDYGDDYFWDPGEVTSRSSREYRIYWIMCRSANPEPIANSFADFVLWVDQWLRRELAESEFEPTTAGIPFAPSKIQTKRRPNQKSRAAWLAFNNHAARDLARAIRNEGRTDAFPVLADALEEAGCDNADVLDSCRTGDPDIDGVWVLRVLLGDGP